MPDRKRRHRTEKEAIHHLIERIHATEVGNDIIYDQRHVRTRATSFNSASRWRGSYGKIPWEDLYKKMELQDWSCMYCKDKISFFNCHFDHVWPIVKGGETYLYNIALTCSTCNLVKSKRSLRRFCQKMDFDYEAITQEFAEINQRLHDIIDWNDGYADRLNNLEDVG